MRRVLHGPLTHRVRSISIGKHQLNRQALGAIVGRGLAVAAEALERNAYMAV